MACICRPVESGLVLGSSSTTCRSRLCQSSLSRLSTLLIPRENTTTGGSGMSLGNTKHKPRGSAFQSRKPFRLNVRAMKETTGSVMRGEGLRFVVVAARFNEIVTRPLVAGALETFQKYAVKDEDVDVRTFISP